MVAKSLSVLSLLVPAAVMAVDLPPIDQEGICRVYMLNDDRLNDSLFMYVDVPVLPAMNVLEAKPLMPVYAGLDLESMDVGPIPGLLPGEPFGGPLETNAIYAAASDDSVDKPGMLYRATINGNSIDLSELGQVCVEMEYPYGSGNPLEERCLEEIDGISFGYAEPLPASGTNPFCIWGAAQDAGLFKVCLTENGKDLVPSTAELVEPFPVTSEIEDLTWNFKDNESSTMLYAVVNANEGPPPVNPNVDPGGFYDDVPQQLWRYDPINDTAMQVCEELTNFCIQIEGMDAIPPNDNLSEEEGDLFMVTYHSCEDGQTSIARVNVDEGGDCEVANIGSVGIDFSVLKTIQVNGHKMQKHADIEGMAWPCPAPVDSCPGMLTYAKDRNDDSTEVPEPLVVEKKHSPVDVGDTNFELYGAAAKQSCDGEITLAVNTNGMMGLGGYESKNLNLDPNVPGSGAEGQRQYNVGDFMIELLGEGDSIDEASVIALYGAHFEINNDTGSTETGLYKLNGDGGGYAGAMSTNSINYGWFNLFAYNLKVKGATEDNHSLAHAPYNFFNMFGPAPTNIDMSIATVTKVADVTVLANRTEVVNATNSDDDPIEFVADIADSRTGELFEEVEDNGKKGLNTEEDNTIGVSFQRPDNDDWNDAKYMRIWIFTECNNDGVVLETMLIPLGD